MKLTILFVGLAFGTAAIACAKQAATTTPVAASRASPTDSSLSPVYTDGKCHFRLQVVPGQGYADKGYMFYANNHGTPSGWGFGFDCHAGASQEDIDILVGAKRVGGKWIWTDADKPFSQAQHLKVTQLLGKNWRGTAVGYDMTTGPEELRQRVLAYCLFETNGPQILCGRGPAMGTSSPATTKLINKVFAVLKTIEFVDTSSVTPASANTTTGR